ncbi:MAG: ribbon-helix-helix protein, CopG family [Burkholderiales bacterium]
MELKTARLTLLVDPNKKAAFERLCARQDRTASQVVRQLIRDYLAAHDVEYSAAGLEDGYAATDKGEGEGERPRVPKTGSKPKPQVAAKSAPASRAGQRRR